MPSGDEEKKGKTEMMDDQRLKARCSNGKKREKKRKNAMPSRVVMCMG